jgi:hypothetical protein
MVTAISIIIVQLVLMLVASVASRDRHFAVGDVDVFQYPSIIPRALFVGGLLVSFVGALVYSTIPVPRTGIAVLIVGAVFGGMAIADMYLYAFFSKYSLRATGGEVAISGLYPTQVVRFAEIVELKVEAGGRLNDRLTIRCADKRILKVGGGIQDFDDLVWLFKSRCPKGTRLLERDSGGMWRESLTG